MRRTVAVGVVRSPFKTIHVTYASTPGEPIWMPKLSMKDLAQEPDESLFRKQVIEDWLASDNNV